MLARVFAQLWDVEGGLLLVDELLAALDPALQLELTAALVGDRPCGRDAVPALEALFGVALHCVQDADGGLAVLARRRATREQTA